MWGRMRALQWVPFAAGLVLLSIGFTINGMWKGIPWGPDALLGGVVLASLALALVTGSLLRCSTATASLVIWLAALGYFCGVSSCGAIALIGASAIGLGTLLVPDGAGAWASMALLVGIGVLVGTVSWLLPFPIHFRAVYVTALLAISLIRWRSIVAVLRVVPEAWERSVDDAPAAALFAVSTLGAVSTCAWLPTVHFDDLAYHLALPAQLNALGYYQMNAGSSVWAVSAWAADVLQGVAWLVAGNESRGAIDILWLSLASTLIWKLCEALDLQPWVRWFAVALYASLPMTAGALGSMQTEGPTAAVVAGLALLIQRTELPSRRHLFTAALLFGGLLGLKISNLMFAGPLGLWLLWRWGNRLPWRSVPVSLVLALLVAGSSYAYAYMLTGNPVLPLFNGFFHSTYFRPGNFHDTHWDSGFDWRTLWNLVFHTSHYVEGGDGSAGFVLVALAGCLLVALISARARPLALVAVTALVLPLTQIQYLRYAHPAFALLLPAMLCGLPQETPGTPRNRIAVVLGVLVIGNLLYVSAADWQLRKGALQQFLVEGRSNFLESYAPIRRIAAVVHDRFGAQARTLITASRLPFAGEFAGRAFVVGWYDPELSMLAGEANRDDSGARWSGIFELTGVNLVVVQSGNISTGLAAALAKYRATRAYAAGDLALWELRGGSSGVVAPSSTNAVAVKFDTSSAAPSATLVSANVKFRCKPQDTPIVLAWQMSQANGGMQSKYEWIHCDWDGLADASFDMKAGDHVTGLMLTAAPLRPVDLGLGLSSADANFRRDLVSDRDLAKSWRNRPLAWAKAINDRRLARRRARRASQ